MTSPYIGDDEFAEMDNVGVKFSAPNSMAEKGRSGNLERKINMESKNFYRAQARYRLRP